MSSEVGNGREVTRSDDPPADADPRVKPALRTLLVDQLALFDASKADRDDVEVGFRNGFRSRREFINWYQRAAVRTLGYITDDWEPADILRDETLLAATVAGGAPNVAPLDETKASRYREVVEASILHPACNRAYRDLRKGATSYISGSESQDAPSPRALRPHEQAHVAMRPGYQVLDQQQEETLDALWGGFDSRDELVDWCHGLNAPTNGEIPAGFTDRVVVDDTARRFLIRDGSGASDRARVYREALAVTILLPAFVEGVRAVDPVELAQRKREPTEGGSIS